MEAISTRLATAARAYGGAGSISPGRTAHPALGQRVSFSEFMENALVRSRNTLQQAEQAQLQGLRGELATQDVVQAVMAAELTIQTVTAVRDRAIQAYQELLRMPI